MFIHDLDCGWMQHPFLRNKFVAKNDEIIRKISDAGIVHVFIDPEQGLDVEVAATAQVVDSSGPAKEATLQEKQVAIDQESARAKMLYGEATSIIRNLMENVRIGQSVKIDAVLPLAERIMQSIFRNPHALTGITRLKTKDEYTFMHCVSVTGLMITFAKSKGLSEAEIKQVAIGSLLHDIGKILVPDNILNKPGQLTPEEFHVMKDHVSLSGKILKSTLGLSQTALDVIMLHHERMDGTGYPLGLKGEAISIVGQMSAIVDVYDALTSVRVYKDAWEPTQALKKMLEWSPNHFSRDLVQQFIRCLGIYPVGSLVELDSGLVGIVLDQSGDMLRPKIKVFYNAKHKHYITQRVFDLSKIPTDKISSAISPGKYGIALASFL